MSTENLFSEPRNTHAPSRAIGKRPFTEEPSKKGTSTSADSADKVAGSTSITEQNYNIPAPTKIEMTLEPTSRLIPLQQWEGFVESIDNAERTFSAVLKDLEQGGNPTDESAEFSLDEIDPDDLELFGVGAVFRWIIGYREQRYGKRERVSSLYFRRRPASLTSELEEAQSRVKRFADAFR